LLVALGVGVERIRVDEVRTLGFPLNMGGPLFLFRDDAPLKAMPVIEPPKAATPPRPSSL
jgi:hypothetical protein